MSEKNKQKSKEEEKQTQAPQSFSHEIKAKTESDKTDDTSSSIPLSSEADALKYKDLYMRTLADFENFKRRNAASIQNALTEGIFAAVGAMLPAYDAIEKAVDMTEGEVKNGMQKVLNGILENFKMLDIEPIESVGKTFNPNLHNAVSAIENNEKSGTVIEEYQKGFKMGEKVLRYSMVCVGK